MDAAGPRSTLRELLIYERQLTTDVMGTRSMEILIGGDSIHTVNKILIRFQSYDF